MLITRDDIQRIGDEDTLLHFLEEKLSLTVPEGALLSDITSKFSNFALGLTGTTTNRVLDCQEFSVSLGKPSGIFLIRFNSEQGYSEALRAIAGSLNQWGRNPTDLRFICADENFQPFAFAYFNGSASEDWQTASLTILTWTQENTNIHTSYGHKLPTGFFEGERSVGLDDFPEGKMEDDFDKENTISGEPETSSSENQGKIPPEVIVKQTSPEELFTKLQNTGAPLSQYENIYSGILTGYNKAFVIDESKRQQLIDDNTVSNELIKPLLVLGQKWKTGLTYLIWIPSSQNRHWPWSDAENEWEARWIFEKVYPAISAHLKLYENQLKRRSHQGEFYWELTPNNLYSMSKHSKIVYPRTGSSMRAAYDASEALPLFPGLFIPTEDLSLLAILNSTLFDWYVKIYRNSKPDDRNRSDFKNAFMKNVPIAARTEEQKVNLSQLVQQILAAPDSAAVPDFEKKIDVLVYKLYELTDAEIELINERERLSPKTHDRTTPSVILTNTQHTVPAKSQTQTEVDRLLEVLQGPEPQPVVSPSNITGNEKATNRLITPVSSDTLLAKLQRVGTPLKQNWSIYTGITPGCVQAFVIDESKRQQIIAIDAKNSELIQPLVRVPKTYRWKPESAYLIWISSSDYNRWPWSNKENESEAERIFEDTYPVVSQHLISYRDILKNRTGRHQGKFYWELSLREPKHENYTVFYQSKIIYPIHSRSMRAFYDWSESLILGSSYCIPTDDLSLLAILNSTLFNWYAQFKCKAPKGKSLLFTVENMVNTPIAERTEKQKEELSGLVQQILSAPNSPNLEEEINMLVYDLYDLTSTEIALIEKGSNQ